MSAQHTPENPNDCASCDHKKDPDGGHCYMFRFTPTEPCAQHTVIDLRGMAMGMQTKIRIARAAIAKAKGAKE